MFLGIEIGGTKLQLGVGLGDGTPPVELIRRDVDPLRRAEGILEQIEHAAGALLAKTPVRAVGIGFGGPFDVARGCAIKSHQIEGWDDFPLADWCRQKLGLPVVIENDCNAAALAEARFGAGATAGIVFFVTVGTGIGGGLVIDGRLHGSGRAAVAEIGHLRPGLDARRPDATVESLASGRGIETAVRSRLADDAAGDNDRADLLTRCDGDVQRLSAKTIAEAASAGNVAAAAVMQCALRALGWAVAQVITLTAAEVVVIGGGVSLIGEQGFFAPLRDEVAQYVFPPLAGHYQIVPAELGEEVVIHGALALAALSAVPPA